MAFEAHTRGRSCLTPFAFNSRVAGGEGKAKALLRSLRRWPAARSTPYLNVDQSVLRRVLQIALKIRLPMLYISDYGKVHESAIGFGVSMFSDKEAALIPGEVAPEHFDVLLSFTGIRGEALIAALRAHFVDGLSQRDAIQQTGVNQSLLSRKTAALQETSERAAVASKYYRKR